MARLAVPADRWTLVIENVARLDLEDPQNVDCFDFNVLVWHPASSTVEVRTGIPLEFQVAVSSLALRIDRDEEEVDQIRRIGIAFP
ncbi:MAG: hypothetical protein AAF481_00755 [Acidobacteriota bacterium]